MKKKTVFIVQAAVIAAVYAALTYAAAMAGLAYGNIQFRFSEALTILAAFTPAAIPGLTVGCLLSNITSPYGIVDVICGTLATLIAAYLSYKTRKITFKGLPLLSAIFPVITNAVIVGLEITLLMPEGFKLTAFLICAAEVALGELIICYALGIPLYVAIKKLGVDKYLK
ncbi:MAG: QueT transporter family protein [Oscillospiraceae bacterium]|nr:QueT transporter family protein [Oscillospiraceae bacterium]